LNVRSEIPGLARDSIFTGGQECAFR
jgi:hypothetical protein